MSTVYDEKVIVLAIEIRPNVRSLLSRGRTESDHAIKICVIWISGA